jgi:HEAT repeat protein
MNIGTESVVPVLLRLLDHSQYDLRRNIAYALFKVNPQMAIPILIELLEDSHDFIREEAVHMLGEIGSKEAIPGLLKIIADQSNIQSSETATPYEWISGVEALTKISPEVAQAESLKLSQHPNFRARRIVADILGNISFEEGGYLLFNLIDDLDYSVQNHASNALEKVKSEAAIPLLLELIETRSDSYICGSAIRALKEISKEGSPEIGKFLPRLAFIMQDLDRKAYQVEALAQVTSKFQENCKFYNYDLTQTTQANSKAEQPTASSPTHITYDLRGANIGNLAENVYGTQQTTQIPTNPTPSQPPETPQ